jgi:ferrochelatase
MSGQDVEIVLSSSKGTVDGTSGIRTAVLLMAYGGPESLDDIEPYLRNVRGGRKTPPALIEEVRERYRLIGGRSPLREITERVAMRLQQMVGLPVFVGMCHWHPYIRDVVRYMVCDRGIRCIVGICMTPHYSAMSVGVYHRRLEEAIAATGEDVVVHFVPNWHLQPRYLEGVAECMRWAFDRFPTADRDGVRVLFTAHSLPAAILAQGDPYDAQLRQTARALADRLALTPDRWLLCYQSAPRTGVPWLGPQVEDVVIRLANLGKRHLLIAPIGFVAEHVEVLYDIDIKVRQIAEAHGAHIERAPMLNDHPSLVAALADLVWSALDGGCEEESS